MINNECERAERDFSEADKSHFKNDAMLNNRNYNNLMRKKKLDETLLRESLSERSTQLILNVSRYLKAQKAYDKLRLCWEELVNRESGNLHFQFERFNTFFKLRDKDSAV